MGVGFVDLFELLGDHLPILGIHFRIGLDSGDFALGFDDRFKDFVRNIHHHTAEHLNQSPIEIKDETLAGLEYHLLCHCVVESDIEHRVHHPRHREFGTRTTGHQQRILEVSELPSHLRFHRFQPFQHLVPHSFRELFTGFQKRVAGFGSDGQSRRNRYSKPGHVGEIGPFAAEQPAHRIPAVFGVGFCLIQFTEQINVFFFRIHDVFPGEV